MEPQTSRPDGKTILAAVTTVASVYVYFLIFAQFGFLKAVQATLGEGAGTVRPVMAVMGLAGISGSVVAGRVGGGSGGRRALAAGFVLCALAALWSLGAEKPVEFHAIALLIGLGTGLTTVTVAGMLLRAVGDGHLGMLIGLGTGLAYGFCNLPAVFEADAAIQAKVALMAVAAGLAGGLMLVPRVPADASMAGDYSRRGVVLWIGIFLVLVCVDSAVFYHIQHTLELKKRMWDGTGQQLLNAGMHLVAAMLAGMALDRRGLGLTVALGAGAVLLAGFMMDAPEAAGGIGLIYIAGVSAYSTALVFYPARSSRPGLAAWVYAVAGWGGSALGIGLAEGRHRLPPLLVVAATIVLAIALMGRRLASRQEQTMNENNRA